ncbi:hypothetical protein C8Q76DRAFT_685963 [Earliella scabrosa]|nr:hypothetical protein C8Q76DRAFT_685963 [Earliella scabrosa]
MATSCTNTHLDQVVYDSPLAVDHHTLQPRGFAPSGMCRRYKHYVLQSRDYILGPMPPDQFLDEFLPVSSLEDRREMTSSRYAFRSVPRTAATPAEIHEPLRTKYKSRAPGLTFHHSPSTTRRTPFSPTVPHICCYTSANYDVVRQSTEASRVELGYAEFFIEVKPDPSHDFFVDPSHTDDAAHSFVARHDDDELQSRVLRALAKHISHVSEIFARQQRVFVFSITMAGSFARLCRWDRSGAVVTERFDIREQPEILCEFVWRFSRASAIGRGHDITVQWATPGEEDLYREGIARHVRTQTGYSGDALDNAVAEHYQTGRVMAIHVLAQHPAGCELRAHRFLVSRPVVSPLSPTGRGTKAYWAFCTRTNRVVFLKDTWRDPMEDEGTTLAKLNELRVCNVPEFVLHGDIFSYLPSYQESPSSTKLQCTKSARYAGKSWVCPVNGKPPKLQTFVHYRIVLGTVGYGLERFRGTSELLHATYDVFQAMKDALRLDSRLHRDISIGNIILVKESHGDVRRGYLVDWESSTRTDANGKALEAGRAGTWEFMSAKVLRESGTTHTLQDDMESLLYVVLYAGLRHLPHNLAGKELTQFLEDFFFQIEEWRGELFGGTMKGVNIANRRMTKRVTFQDAMFQQWLNTVLDLQSSMETAYEPEDIDMWSDTSHLESFWATFLAENALEQTDRVDNAVEGPNIPTSVLTLTPPVLSPAPPSPQQAGPSSRASKRKPTAADRGEQTKRPRTRAAVNIPVVVRRSARLRKQEPTPSSGVAHRSGPSKRARGVRR